MFYKHPTSNCEDSLHIDTAFREWPKGKHSFEEAQAYEVHSNDCINQIPEQDSVRCSS